MAKVKVLLAGPGNKVAWIETEPVLATKAVLGQNLFATDSSGNHVLLQASDILNAGTVQALAGSNLVQADNPGSKIGSTTATSPTGKGVGGIGSGTNLTGDVSASITGPGTFTVTVTGIKGHNITAAPTTNGQILIYSTAGAGSWTALVLSGDATMGAGGVVTITANAVSNSKLATMPANTFKGNNTGASATPVDLTVAQMQTALGVVAPSMAAFGSTPNANGGTFTGSALTLQPASATLPGGVTAGAQTFGGAKTWNGVQGTGANNSFPGAASSGASFWYTDATLGLVLYGFGTAADMTLANRAGTAVIQFVANSTTCQFSGDVDVVTAGKGLRVSEGANGKQGTATLVAGTVVVSNTSVTTNSRIFLTAQNNSGTVGSLSVSARTAGTSFTIKSTSAADTSLVAYEIFEPG